MTKEQIIQNIKTRISTIESYHPEEYVLNKGILLELKDLLSTIEEDKPSLPSNLDEAAKEYLKQYNESEFGNGGDDWDDDILITFKAGAEWMAEQGHTVDGTFHHSCGYPSVIELKTYLRDYEGADVIVQIRKK